MMSRSTKAYSGAALALIAFPLVVALWGGSSSAVIAILLIGTGGYGFAVCLLLASFWHRYRRGTWPVEIPEDPTVPRYPKTRAARSDSGDSGFRVGQLLGWLKKPSSNL